MPTEWTAGATFSQYFPLHSKNERTFLRLELFGNSPFQGVSELEVQTAQQTGDQFTFPKNCAVHTAANTHQFYGEDVKFCIVSTVSNISLGCTV